MYIVVILIGISAPLSLVLADKLFIDPTYLSDSSYDCYCLHVLSSITLYT